LIMRFWKVGLAAVVVLAVAGGGTYWYTNRDQTPNYSTTTVTKGDISVSINGSGNLALSNTKNIIFSAAAKVSSILVVEGQAVTKDQPLLTLDTAYFQTQLKSLQDASLQAQKALIQAQINVQNSQASLDKLNVPYTADQIASAWDNVLIDQAAILSDQTNLTLAITKNDAPNIQKWSAQLDKDQRTLTTDSNSYQAMVTATPDPQQLSLAQLSLQLAQSALIDAQNNVTTAQAAVDTAKAPPSTLYAPFTGVVSTINAVAGNSYKTNDTAMIMVNTGIITVNIQVSEANIFKIKVGQDAAVTVTSTNAVYPAKITFISSNATTSQGVVSYRVTVTLNQNTDPSGSGGGAPTSISQLKAGLTTVVGIVVAQSKNTLLLSNSAITTVNGVSTVQVLGADGKLATKTITTGIGDLTNTEVTSGLSEGDVVIIPLASTASGSSKPTTTTSSGNILQPTQTSSPVQTVTIPGGGGGSGGFTLPSGGGGFTPPVVTR
jgi:multidrug efflux pump subunit AcrA (membrane-fusion protein)